jgi:transposase-like protein
MARIAVVGDRKKQAGWHRHLKAQSSSGLSIAAYCRRHGLREHGFYWWRRELARRKTLRREAAAAFVSVTVAAEEPIPAPEGRIEIVLPGNRRVRVTGPVNRQLLSDVLGVLEKREGER